MSENYFVSLDGWEEADSFNQLPPSGQICTIVNAYLARSKNSGNQTLYVEVDVAQGEFKDYFLGQKKHWNNDSWSSRARLYVPTINQSTGKVNFRLKNFLLTVEESNPNFKVDTASGKFDIRALKGKFIGVVFGGKEGKLKKDSTERYINAIADHFITVQKIKDGDFTVPAVIPFEENSSAAKQDDFAGSPVDKKDLPFDPEDTPF